MKRSSLVPLILGAIVAAIIIAARVSGLLHAAENAVSTLFPGSGESLRFVGAFAQYLLVVFLSCGVVWLVVTSTKKERVAWLLGLLALELLVVSWIGLLYQVFFQPLPSILAVGLGLGVAHAYLALAARRSGSHFARDIFSGRLAEEQIARVTSGEVPFEPVAKSYEVTVVVCDIANKHDLPDDCSPAQVAEVTTKFIGYATESFLKAGAFIETVTGEGIVAVFGFPADDSLQAEKATRHALSLLESFEKMRASSKDECFGKFNVHLGVSSGTMIISPLEQEDRVTLFSTGEPVELARRFCIANRFYGSRVLIGPRTFEMTSKAIVSRPIDFLSGVDVRERHEIYEPLVLASEATPEEIARRDSFWNGVVLYREKRWGEAYAQFQKARGPNDLEDAPLQLYVRRIEPLALHLVDSADE